MRNPWLQNEVRANLIIIIGENSRQQLKNQDMLKQIIIELLLIFICLSASCQYYTSSSCTSVGCSWNNNTCILGSGICQGGWIYYTPIQECVQCSGLASTNCSSICTQYYFSSNTGTCQSCSNINSNCLTCTETQCNSCISGFSVDSAHKNQCLIDSCKIRFCTTCETKSTCYACQTGYTPSLASTICSASACSISNCLYCFDSSSCVTCRSGYSLSQSGTTCTAICTDQYCKSCSSPSVCTQCLSGYTFNSNTGYCQLLCTVIACSACDLSTTCTACASGYTVNNAYTLCNPICTDQNCATCTSQTNCIQCNLGYYLTTSNTCAQAMCYIENCQVCLNTISCKTCDSISTISPNNSTCTQNCLGLVANCRVCATNTTCTACNAGYQLMSPTSCNVACHINNCLTCLTNNLCQNCLDGYMKANGGATCIFNCGILNCITCNSSKTCQTCANPYVLSSSSTSCDLICSPGFYLNAANPSSPCQSCSSAKSNCLTCSLTSGIFVACSNCQDLYYLTSNGDCVSCSSKIANCLLCLDPINCISCMNGYNLVYQNGSYGCALPYSCSVANCKQCSSNNPLYCMNCSSAYYLTNNNLNCSLIVCLDTQYYDSLTLSCVCPFGTFLINQKCSYCNIDNCVTCNSGGCISCKSSYYATKGVCSACSDHCANCTSGTSCLQCDYGYTLLNGVCSKLDDRYGSTKVSGSNGQQTVICPPGCSKCTYYQGQTYCTLAKDGYAVDSSGSVMKCIDTCKTCINTDYTICTSCYGASILNGGACSGCSDLFALSCPLNVQYSTSCVIGYSPIRGVCRQCASNCLTCGKAGAGFCDDGGCGEGYVKVVGTSNCTQCFSSCASCSKNNPSVCLSCGGSSFLSNTSSCVSCPSTCLSCSSLTVCKSCPQGSILDSQWCYPIIGAPCASQSKSVCTSCYLGYNLVKGVCQVDNTCNGTKTCSNCDKGFYLKNRQCFACSTNLATCDYCQPLSPSSCLYCASGYYLSRSGSICKSCSSAQTGCALCESAQRCTAALDGYYLQLSINKAYTGNVKACKNTCATCSRKDTCDTCPTGYQKIGTNCFYNQNVQVKLTVNSGKGSSTWYNSNHTDEENLAQAFLNTNQFKAALAFISLISDLERILLTYLGLGSLVIEAKLVSDPSQDLASFSSNIESNINSIPDFTVISSVLTVNGLSSTTSTANLGLILGITIPLVILLIVIIIFIKTYLGDSDEKQTQETEKEVQQFQM